MNAPQFKRQWVLKTILRPNVTDRQRERAREGLLISILYATLHLVTGQSLWPSSRGRRARLPGLPAGRPRQLLERRGRRKRSRARHRTRPIATSCYSIQIQKKWVWYIHYKGKKIFQQLIRNQQQISFRKKSKIYGDAKQWWRGV